MIFQRWRIILLLFVIIVFLLQFVWKLDLPFVNKLKTDVAITAIFRPVGDFISVTSTSFTDKFRNYFTLASVAKENWQLRNEAEKLKIENDALKTQVVELSSYRDALSNYSLKEQELIPARIISQDLISTSKTVLIDKGTKQGVLTDAVVVTGDGLAGRVIEAFPRMSKVLLLIDKRFSVDSVNVRSGIRILVSGASYELDAVRREPYLTQVEYLENAREMREGDPIKTSGLGGVFPEGIPVGNVEAVDYSTKNLFDKVRVLPAIDFTKLIRVFVIVNKKSAEAEQ